MDKINHPSHYNKPGKKECIVEMRETHGRLVVYGFDLGNEFKYDYRAGEKQDNPYDQDLSKARWYCSHSDTVWNSWNWFQKLIFLFAKWVCK